MAQIGYIKTLLNGIQDEATKNALMSAFDYLLRQNALGESPKATNFAWYRVDGISASVAGTEFSIPHGLGVAPVKFIPVVDLSAPGNSLIPLTVSRTPDAKRIYFISTATNTPYGGFLE